MNKGKVIEDIKSNVGWKTRIFILFVFIDSLFFSSKIGTVSLLLVTAYFLVNRKNKDIYKITFAFSFSLILTAVLFFLWDSTGYLDYPIEKLSEWAYLLFLVGNIQLIVSLKNKWKK